MSFIERFFRSKKRKHEDLFRTCALVVDDEPEIVFLISRTLEWMDVIVDIASGDNAGEEAKKKFNEQHFDIVFVDLNMPNTSGIELIKYIQRHYHKVMVVIVSGYMESRIRELTGFLGIIQKPFTQEQIREVLEKCRLPYH